MNHVLVVGAGLSGCTIANELSENGVQVTLLEATNEIGGKVKAYGCKATDKCNNCGVCLTVGLWEKVQNQKNIKILTNSKLVDLTGEKGDFTASIKNQDGIFHISNLSQVVVSTGFEKSSLDSFNGFVEYENVDGIITGSEIEMLLKDRKEEQLFQNEPKSVAFIQCFGSRDIHEHAMYCSKVCCSYTTRAAKVIKHFYPECEIVFYYMEMQMVNQGDYFKSLQDAGLEFIKCRPIKVTGGSPASVTYDNPSTGKRETRNFDLVVLSDGIHPNQEAKQIAEICGFGQDESGFLKYVTSPSEAEVTGVFVSGCAKGPKKIEETYSESMAIAKGILFA